MLPMLLDLYLSARHGLWRVIHLPLPARPGWEALVREVKAVDVYSKDGVVGAPLAWSLLTRDAEGKIQPVEATCAVSGLSISGAPVDADGEFDVTRFGVRCARCGIALHATRANMRTVVDVPSCPPCRRAVRRVLES